MRRRLRWGHGWVAWVVVSLVAGGTGAAPQDLEATQKPRSTVRDSAGVEIVENERPPDGSRLGWRIGSAPSVSIGQVEGEDPYLFHFVVGATRLDDGRILVADAGSAEIRVFDSSGIHLATWGGRGEGPGEFSGDLMHVKPWTGDSIVAWHGQAVSMYDSEGRYGRTLRFAGPGDFFHHAAAVLGDGTFLATGYAGGNDLVVEIRTADGGLAYSLGEFPFREVYEVAGGPEGNRPGVAPVAYSLDMEQGRWGDFAFVGVTNRYEIRVFGSDGALARIVRRDHVPRATTRSDIDHYVEQALALWADSPPDQLRRIRQAAAATPLARTFPAFRWARGDAAGHLWVREFDFPGEPRPAPLWTVFDPGGRVLGFVETPPRLRVLEIGEDYILGRTEDELGVESIQLWPLERS